MSSAYNHSSTELTAWTLNEQYYNTFLVEEDDVLKRARQNSDDNGLPQIAVSASQGKYLNLVARSIGAKRILEVGTLGGYSTIWFARALPEDGEVVTLELLPKHVQVAKENIEFAGLTSKTKFIQGNLRDTMPALPNEPLFDLIFIDADYASKAFSLKESKRLLRKGGIAIVDNVVRQGKVADESRATEHEHWNEAIRDVLRLVKEDEDFEATTITTVGEKGYDGFLFAIRK